MKKLTIIATGLMLFLGTTAFANEGEKKSGKEVSPIAASFGGTAVTANTQVSKSFNATFASAENVSWKQRDEFYFADFKLNDKNMFAAFSADGELLGITRNLELSQLPMHVEMAIKEKYKDYRIINSVTEMVFQGETTYHLQAENKTRILQLKSDSDGQIYVVQRTKKKLVGSVY